MYSGDISRLIKRLVTDHGLACVVLVALVTAFLWDVLLLDRSLSAFDLVLNQPSWNTEFPVHRVHEPILLDSPTAHYPQRKFDWDMVRAMQNPIINPYLFTGMPWGMQGLGAYVTSLSQWFLDVPDAIDWSTWFRMILAGLFMYLLLVELRTGTAAAIFGGILWVFNLHQVLWLEFPQHLGTQLWMPLLLYLNLVILRYGLTVERFAAFVLVNMLFATSDYTQIVLYTDVCIVIFNTLYLLLDPDHSWPRKARAWLLIHGLYLVAFVGYALFVVNEAQLLTEGLRGAQEWRGRIHADAITIGSIPDFLVHLLPPLDEIKRFYTPDYFGGIWSGSYKNPDTNQVEGAAYFGVFGVVMMIYAAVSAWRANDWRMRATLFVTLGLTFAFLYRDPVAIAILKLVPFVGKGGYSRFLTHIVFFGCLLAAVGFKSLVEDIRAGRQRRFWIASLAFIAAPFVARLVEPTLDLAKFAYPLLLWACLATVVVLAARRITWIMPIVVLIIAASAADLFHAGYAFNTRMENRYIFPTNNAIRFLQNDRDDYRVAVMAKEPLYHPNVLSYYKIPVIEGYSTVMPDGYVEFIRKVMGEHLITTNGILFLFDPPVKVLRMLNVKYLLSDQDLRREGLTKVLNTNNHFIYKVDNHLPRAYCPSEVRVAEGWQQSMRRYREIYDTRDRPMVLEQGKESEGISRCDVSALKVYTDRVTFTTNTSDDYFVYLPYGYQTGWRANVNGRETGVLRANGEFLAVPVPKGGAQVVVYYSSPVAVWASIVAMATALVLMIMMLVYRRGSVPVRVTVFVVSALLVSRSALSIPGIRNDAVPERPRTARATVEIPGLERRSCTTPSEPLGNIKTLTLPLPLNGVGLTRLDLKAATYRQDRLPYSLAIRLENPAGKLLAKTVVPGDVIHDNAWFSVNFPTLLAKDVRISISAADGGGKPFSLWVDEQKIPCFVAYYDRNTRVVK